MPHTSHRKRRGNQNKRQEILGEDGWTRVTKAAAEPNTQGAVHWVGAGTDILTDISSRTTVPMVPVKGSSLESMQAKYSRVEATWLETELCKKLSQILTDRALTGANKISTCVLLGSGSFCGDAIHWVDRHETAYFQLAAFKTAVGTIERAQGQRISVYAQEPYYNELDAALLASLDITKVDHPRGFELLDDRSLVYSPAAEPGVEQNVLARTPQIWLHRFFDPFSQDDMVDRFRKNNEHSDLPPALDLRYMPFHGSVIWWKKQDDLEDT